jgi:hypothetical protein
MPRSILTILVTASALIGCKQSTKTAQDSMRVESSAANQQFNLSAPVQTTGQLTITALFEDDQTQFASLALVECNSADVNAAIEATRNLNAGGARRQNSGRSLTLATTGDSNAAKSLPNGIDCHIMHPEAIIDAKSLTLINERIRGYTSFRTATRSDIAIYELAQLAWVGLKTALAGLSPVLSREFVDPKSPIPTEIITAKFNAQLIRSGAVYDPCISHASEQIPRWLTADPEIRFRQFDCADHQAFFKFDQLRTYPAVRHALRSALVGLYRESRGMQPELHAFQDEVSRSGDFKFLIAPVFHSITTN